MDYIRLIGTITGHDISSKDNVGSDIDKLEASCASFNRRLNLKPTDQMHVKDTGASIQEPCPVCMSSRHKKAELVFVGLNPYKDTPQFNQSITWKELEDYHIPESVYNTPNVFDYVSGGSGKRSFSKYYLFILRLLTSIVNKTPVKDAKGLERYMENGESRVEFFKRMITEHPIMCAEMFPYKTVKFLAYSADRLLTSPEYKSPKYELYLRDLFEAIRNKVSDNGCIVFFGQTKQMVKILQYFNVELPAPKVLNGQTFYFKKINGITVVLSPFIQPGRSKNYSLESLLTEILK